jgi:glycosyltransferase involved in cell wall biosynthesis
MRVLIAVNGYPPAHSAGAERLAERIGQWLLANHHEVEVFAIERLDDPNYRVESGLQDGIRVHRLYYNLKRNDNYFTNLYSDPLVGEAFQSVLSQNTFDLVHIVSGYLLGGQVIPIAKQHNLPVIITLTEYWFMCSRLNLIQPTRGLCIGPESDEKCARCLLEDKRRYRLPAQIAPQLANAVWPLAKALPFVTEQTQAVKARRTVLQSAFDSADAIICPSQFIIDKFASFGFDTSRCRLIRHGLAFTSNDTPTVERDSTVELRLGFIGQVKRHKGVDLLIDAVVPLLNAGHRISLDVWGPEHEEPQYVAALKQQSAPYPTIRWNGRYMGSKVWGILDGFDVLVVPSRWYENSPIVINEANRMGLPVIATNLGGMAEMVDPGKSGLVFELDNANDLRNQIQRLLTEPGLLAQLQAGIPPIKRIDDEMQEVFAQYRRVLNV